jgi:hypothetical protein
MLVAMETSQSESGEAGTTTPCSKAGPARRSVRRQWKWNSMNAPTPSSPADSAWAAPSLRLSTPVKPGAAASNSP